MVGHTRHARTCKTLKWTRRFVSVALPLAFILPGRANAQMSQRARQIRERRACEQDLPTCRPEIRAQLEDERRRLRWGLSGLALAVAGMTGLLWRRHRSEQLKNQERLSKLHDHVSAVSGKTAQNQAQSASHESEET